MENRGFGISVCFGKILIKEILESTLGWHIQTIQVI